MNLDYLDVNNKTQSEKNQKQKEFIKKLKAAIKKSEKKRMNENDTKEKNA